MADFKQAVTLTLQHEGGYVNNPADPGGETNMGVEQRDLPNIPIKTLTVAQATEFYRVAYWKPLYSQINSQLVANKIFDFGVLFGVGTAVKTLQGALGLVADGSFGPMSLAKVNTYGDAALPPYRAAMHAHVLAIITAHPAEGVFAAGWSHRIDS